MEKARRVYLLRSFLAPTASLRWTRFIREFHIRFGAPAPVDRVLAKPVRNYVHRRFWPRQRLALLLAHYQWFADAFSPEFLRRFCSNEEIQIAELHGRKQSSYRIFVAASVVAVLQREGEIALYLSKSAQGVKLCRLSFSYSNIEGEPAFVIGGVQGPLAAHKREVIDATRELYGLRPKDAILLAARALAQSLGIAKIHAVSDANHVLNRLQESTKFSSYDEYWRERGAVEGGPFGFMFEPLGPAAPAKDKRDEIKIAITNAVTDFLARNRKAEPST